MPSDANPVLAALRDIHGAPDIPWWPPAPGWWVLAIALLIVLLWAGIRLTRYLRRLALKRRVIRQLKACQQDFGVNGDVRALASRVNLILKRVALRRFGRKQISMLHGIAWARFLCESGGQPDSGASWQQLAIAPYRAQPALDADTSLELARGWVRQHV